MSNAMGFELPDGVDELLASVADTLRPAEPVERTLVSRTTREPGLASTAPSTYARTVDHTQPLELVFRSLLRAA